MASAARDLRYRGGRAAPVDGNLARSLDWEVRERELRHAGEAPRRREAAREKPRAQSVPKVRLRQAQRVSVPVLLSAAVVAALSVLVLMNYIHLTVLSNNVVELRNELKVLDKENVVLTAQHEQMFDLASVKAAAEAAGMTKPSSSQVYYVDISGGDTAVVYGQGEAGLVDRLLESLHHGIYAVVEYFD